MENEIELKLFTQIGALFDSFIKKEENTRIIFAGKFGTGKTTFLKTYFENSEKLGLQKNNYELFPISPVNYSVAENKDIN